MVPAAELAKIQADTVAAVCDKSADIYHKTTTKDASGLMVDSWPTKAATVVCGMRQPSGGELANFDFLIGDKIAWTVMFPVATLIVEQDHLIIEGQTLEVHVVLTPKSYPALLACICAEIK